jgi:uncharacterized NAD(P)/FAD-binding protein YdhS
MIERCSRIGIIGAGFTGTMLAVHLLRRANTPTTIHLIDRATSFGRGLAYSTESSCHLLNTCADRMSAFEDDPSHFLRWLERTSHPGEAWAGHHFAPRGRYGDYLEDLLVAAMQDCGRGVKIELVTSEAVAIEPGSAGPQIALSDGRRIGVDHAVLCTGHPPAGAPMRESDALARNPRYIADPWDNSRCDRIAPEDSVLFIGTGLTMVDCVAELAARHHRGPLHAVSRRGLLPQAHAPGVPYPPFLDRGRLPQTVLGQLRLVRAEIERAAAGGVGWRSVMEQIRPMAQDCWRVLPPAERQRFLRHLRPYWDTHRHRMAPAAALEIEALRQSGRLTLNAGRVVAVEPVTPFRIRIMPRGQADAKSIEADWIVNCAGAERDYRRVEQPLIRDVIDSGRARLDPLCLGLDIAADCALIEADGSRSSSLFALGIPTRGALWEITAVAELRGQCAALAERLAPAMARTQRAPARAS